MGLFSKIKHSIHHTSSMFNHVGSQAKSIFDHVNKGVASFVDHGKIAGVKLIGPGSIGSQALSGISKGAAEAGSALGSAGKGLASFANNSIVQSVLSTTPIGTAVLDGMKAGAVGLQAGKGLAKEISYGTKQKNYSGSPQQVIGQIRGNIGAVKGKSQAFIDQAKLLQKAHQNYIATHPR
jgi:hypothetical protein